MSFPLAATHLDEKMLTVFHCIVFAQLLAESFHTDTESVKILATVTEFGGGLGAYNPFFPSKGPLIVEGMY